MKEIMRTTLNILTSVYSPALIVKYLKKWDFEPFYHSYFVDNQHYQNGWGHYHYGFRFGNLYLERKLAIDTTVKATYNINEFLSCHYKIQKLAHNSKTPNSTSGLYTLLISGADGEIDRNKIIVRDKRNKKEVYNLYQTLIRSIYKYINRKSNDRTLLLEIENPWHSKKHIYSHPHLHGALQIADKDRKQIENKLKEKFEDYFGYKPTKCKVEHLKKKQNQTNLEALDIFVKYLLQDRKIQTKDTDQCFFDGIHSKLRYNQLHLTFNAQLNSAKGHRQAYFVSNQTIKSELTKLYSIKKEIHRVIINRDFETENALVLSKRIIFNDLNNNKKKSAFKKQTKRDNLKNAQKNINQVIRQKEVHNSQQIHNNLTYANSGKIRQNKKIRKSTHFHNKYTYKYTTSGIPP